MIRLLAGLLAAATLIACASLDCGWRVEVNDDSEAHLLYECNF